MAKSPFLGQLFELLTLFLVISFRFLFITVWRKFSLLDAKINWTGICPVSRKRASFGVF